MLVSSLLNVFNDFVCKARRDTLVLPAFLLALVFSSTTPPFHDVVSCKAIIDCPERTQLPVASTDSTIEPPYYYASYISFGPSKGV